MRDAKRKWWSVIVVFSQQRAMVSGIVKESISCELGYEKREMPHRLT